MTIRAAWLGLGFAVLCGQGWSRAQEPPLEADLPLVFLRALDAVLLEVLKGLHPVLPPAALQPEQAGQHSEPLAVGPSGIAGLRLEPAFDLAGLGLDPTVVVGEPAAGLALHPTLPAEGGLAVPAVNPAPASPALAQPLRVDARLAATAAGPGPVEVETAVAAGPPTMDLLLPNVLARLRAGDASPDVLRQVRRLSREELLAVIAGTPNRSQTAGLLDALTTILVEVHGFEAALAADLDGPLQIRLGMALGRLGKPDAVPLLEGLLAKRSGPTDGGVPELVGLCAYYLAVGQPGKAAEALLRVDAYSTSAAHQANHRIDAARCLRQAGDRAGAEAVTAQVAAFGYGWTTGMAAYERAEAALRDHRLDEAEAILAAPVEGDYADQIQVALELLRGALAEERAQLGVAQACYRRVRERYDALAAPLPGEGLEQVVARAAARLALLDALAGHGLVADAAELVVPAALGADKLVGRMRVAALAPQALTLGCEAAGLTVRTSGDWRRQGLVYEATVVVEQAGVMRLGPWESAVTVAVEGARDEGLTIPLRRVGRGVAARGRVE